VVVAAVVLATGPNLVHLYDTTVATCAAHHDCSAATSTFLDTDGPLQVFFDFFLLAVPGLIGMFWGAPLVAREFETGTVRLAWTQGVTRTRWLEVKLGLGVLFAVTLTGLLSLMVTSWSSDLDLVRGNVLFDPLGFGVRDIVPIGYAAFAFVLGLAAGLVVRRTLPAMLAALVGFVAVRALVTDWVRPRLFAPLHKIIAASAGSLMGFDETPAGMRVVATTRGLMPNAWIYSNALVTKSGRPLTQSALNQACPFNQTTGEFNAQRCTANIAARFSELLTYQPTSRFWGFQWYETAIFLGLAALLAGLCFFWIRRPIS
jgi:ABC-type transport system involved in multi-copper enzyme maturation permease subunit